MQSPVHLDIGNSMRCVLRSFVFIVSNFLNMSVISLFYPFNQIDDPRSIVFPVRMKYLLTKDIYIMMRKAFITIRECIRLSKSSMFPNSMSLFLLE